MDFIARSSCARRLTTLVFLLAWVGTVGAATADGYRQPPEPLADIVDTPPTPGVSLSPDRSWMLLMEQPSLPSIEELAEPELRLAGLRIRPRTNGPSRTRPLSRLTFKRLDNLKERDVTGLPAGARIGRPSWSPDSNRIAFAVTGETDIELWVAEVGDGKARRLGHHRLNGAAGGSYRWLPDSKSLLCATVPAGRGEVPPKPAVPSGPVVRQNLGRTAPARTYQDLLKNPHDEAVFEYYVNTQLALLSLDGKSEPFGEPGLILGFDPSPDGRFVLVQSLHRPFSYLVPMSRFPRKIAVLDRDGSQIHLLADLPLQEEIPLGFGSVATGPRSVAWRDDADATLVWAEALDGGNARQEAELRDRVLMLPAPFTGTPRKLIDLGLRYAGVDWANDELALVSGFWWSTRQVRAWRIRPGNPDAEPELVEDRSWEDRYNDPGQPVSVPNKAGRSVILVAPDGHRVFLTGAGASPDGDRPFLDAADIDSHEKQRLWQSEAPYYERPVALLDEQGQRMITRRESRELPPNYYLRDVKSGELRQLTDFPHPTPQLVGLTKEQLRYERADGVKLTGTLYVPPEYDKDRDGRLPLLMWAYPQEFKSADAAGQVTDSPYRFDRVGWYSALLFLTQGYAVLDDPTLPIVGEGAAEPNDSYIEQLVAGAQAAVDEVVRRGVADRERIAIGGHSYGAFMTANLLAHSDIFRAGIARSGAYNRTLTPFGFQAEERTFWEAPEVYFSMSPFMHAEQLDEPILLIHGEADNNSGTYPMQSERFYNALKGLGGTTRLVMLPHESHGYQARESVMHMLWEMTTWLDTFVKQAAPRDELAEAGEGDRSGGSTLRGSDSP